MMTPYGFGFGLPMETSSDGNKKTTTYFNPMAAQFELAQQAQSWGICRDMMQMSMGGYLGQNCYGNPISTGYNRVSAADQNAKNAENALKEVKTIVAQLEKKVEKAEKKAKKQKKKNKKLKKQMAHHNGQYFISGAPYGGPSIMPGTPYGGPSIVSGTPYGGSSLRKPTSVGQSTDLINMIALMNDSLKELRKEVEELKNNRDTDTVKIHKKSFLQDDDDGSILGH